MPRTTERDERRHRYHSHDYGEHRDPARIHSGVRAPPSLPDHRQVGDQGVELAVGAGGERGGQPVLELGGEQPALGGCVSQALGDVLAVESEARSIEGLAMALRLARLRSRGKRSPDE